MTPEEIELAQEKVRGQQQISRATATLNAFERLTSADHERLLLGFPEIYAGLLGMKTAWDTPPTTYRYLRSGDDS